VDRPGIYLGQCAEFCGLEHAFMRLTVTAESPDAYDQWAAAQRAPAPEPQTDRQKQGHDVFMNTSCIMCHTISGTKARAQLGPDLSHIGSRPLIGGKLENRREHLSAWILNPQAIKPGVRMPVHALSNDQLEPLLDYLQMLK
jgi:cytochrome c oxidase subunit 2